LRIITSKENKKLTKNPYLFLYWKMLEGPDYAKDMVAQDGSEVKKAQKYIDVFTNKMVNFG
jgi:hypothetical protein